MNTKLECVRVTPADAPGVLAHLPGFAGSISPPTLAPVHECSPARRSSARWTEADLAHVGAPGLATAAPVLTPGQHKRPRRQRPEDAIQRAVCQFWELAYPETWRKTFHPPNGLAAKNPKLAGIFKGLGVKPGVFDLLCIARRGPYNGFALELKAARGRASENQTTWAEHYYSEGWSVAICFSLDAALRAIREYQMHAPPHR